MNNDIFKFVMPAEIEKSADGEWKVSGLASTSGIDRQGEVILPSGIDATPIANGKGFFNWDHDNSPESTVGLLDGYRKSEEGMYVTGRLFKNHTKAKAVYEIMTSLGKSDKGRVGLSVEGKVLERDPLNPKIIRKCVVKNVALTMSPVNTDTYADIIKSFAGSDVEFDSNGQPSVQQDSKVVKSEEQPTFTATQVVQMIEKALGIGAGNSAAPADRSGGDALGVSNMSEKPKKKKVKEMSKSMFKSNMEDLLTKLQVLHPDCTRDQIWQAVKERMNTSYEAPDFQKSKKDKVMNEFKEGKLHSGSKKGPKVTNPKQAVAIAYSEEREAKVQKGGPGSGQKGHTTLQNDDSPVARILAQQKPEKKRKMPKDMDASDVGKILARQYKK